MIPTGGGTKLDWGNPPRRADVLLSMLRQNRIIEHAWADLVVFDPARVRDTATYDDPHRFPVGIDHVLVRGAMALESGETTRERGGRFLRLGPDLGGA